MSFEDNKFDLPHKIELIKQEDDTYLFKTCTETGRITAQEFVSKNYVPDLMAQYLRVKKINKK